MVVKVSEFEVIRHQVRKDRERLIRRLERHVALIDGHHVWTGRTEPNGYGRINFTHTGNVHVKIYTHRLFLILRLGRPITKGMEAGHTCTNSLCVEHLEEQTHEQNMKEMNGRRWKKDVNDCPF